MQIYDVAIIGLGSMGMACTYYAMEKGASVLGIDQFSSPHNNGSHHGQSRIIRKAYFEHPDYVPLLEKAYINWKEIEVRSNTKLFYKTGLNYFGTKSGKLLNAVTQSSKKYDVPIKNHMNDNGFKFSPDIDGLFEPEAGFILPESTIKAYKGMLDQKNFVEKTTVLAWQQKEGFIAINTNNGTYHSKKLIITVGAWISSLIPNLKELFKVTQQALAWIDIKDKKRYSPENFSCWNIETIKEGGIFYGFPYLESNMVKQRGIKLAHHYPEIETDIDNRTTSGFSNSIR